jgi:hypothetical protein
LNGKKSVLQTIAAAEDAALASLKASESQLGTTVTDAEAALAAQKVVVETKRNALAEATTAESASSADLSTKRSEHATSQAAVEKLQGDKTAIESAFAEHFKPMEEGEGKSHLKQLEPFLKQIEIESTLLTALPSTCAKSKEKRGTFDNLVLQELEKAFSAKITALGDAVVAEGPASSAREAAIQVAEKDHETKDATKTQAAAESAAAEKEQGDREAALSAANTAVDDFQPQLAEKTGRLATAQKVLSEFEAGPLANFAAFKTRIAAPLVEEVPEEVAPAEDAPAEGAPAEVAAVEVTPAEVAA